ncbi:hypothetical protein ACWEOZ_12280 [Actinoplanes sp. NPDC004185]
MSRRLQACSSRIAKLARHADRDSGQVLTDLSTLLRMEPAGLVGVDLAQFYPPDTLLPDLELPNQKLITRLLVGLRDGLVFLPVAVTWVFLSRAFGKEIPEGQTFLAAWGPELTTTAIVVSVAVFLVIVATVGLHVWDWWIDRECSRADLREQLRQELAAASVALAEDARHLQPVPAADIQRLGYFLGTSVEALQAELRRTGEQLKAALDTGPASRFAEALAGWSKAADQFSTIAPTLVAPAEMLEDFVRIRKELTEENLRMMERLGALVAQVQDSTAALGQESQAHHGVAGRVLEMTRQMGHAMEDFVEQSMLINQASDRVYDMLQRQVGAFGPVPMAESPAQPPSGPATNGQDAPSGPTFNDEQPLENVFWPDPRGDDK